MFISPFHGTAHAVHDRDPRVHPDAHVVSELLARDESIELNHENHDVSGAMFGKIEMIRKLCLPKMIVTVAPPKRALEAIIGPIPNPNFTTVRQ